ncbi:hypothetical protein Pyn_24395 [Prunus yedoensis var. nudiflora]|uniref:Uncharacterized protein n=1 Tax=Prunus yedoensis var. nudiflora TaxID=2094558 RepID=A0A314YBQ8_PRUYE|nr:hypothetical protein Pyn_24395 [Prunus yedoensis var. nudiflora]
MGTDQNGFMGRNGYKGLGGVGRAIVQGKQKDVGEGSRLGRREKSDLGLEDLVALLARGGIISFGYGLDHDKSSYSCIRDILCLK